MIYASYSLLKDKERLMSIRNLLREVYVEGNPRKKIVNFNITSSNMNNIIKNIKASIAEYDYIEISCSWYRFFKKCMNESVEQYMEIAANKDAEKKEYVRVIDDIIAIIDTYYGNIGSIDWTCTEKGRNSCKTWEFRDNTGYEFQNDMISRMVKMLNCDRQINVIDINCKDGQSARYLKSLYPKANLYAWSYMEQLDDVNPEDLEQMQRIAVGSINECRISNDSFDVVLVRPALKRYLYTYVAEDIGYDSKSIEKSWRCLKKNGVMFCAVPFTRINENLANYIAKHFDNIQVISNEEMLKDNIVVIAAQKSFNSLHDADENFNMLRNIVLDNSIINLNENDDKKFTLASKQTPIENFRGAYITDSEIKMLYKKSEATNKFWKSQKVNKIEDKDKHSLLPFNSGQLGLVLTSGYLDGVVFEDEGCSHIVKGRVIKTTSSERNYSGGEVEVTTLVGNKVEITCFLPDGTFKKIA